MNLKKNCVQPNSLSEVNNVTTEGQRDLPMIKQRDKTDNTKYQITATSII